jgi:hypothetical protein
MRKSLILAAAFAACAALASCDQPSQPKGPPAAGAAFTHVTTMDASGYFMPLSEVRIGDWELSHLFLGQEAEFDAWEAGQRSETFAPVMLQFDNLASPMVQTEIGEARSVTSRALPSFYSVSDTRVQFEGRSPELGRISFDGRMDPGALATARRNLGDEGAVVTGDLIVGGRTVRGVRLRWWGGD